MPMGLVPALEIYQQNIRHLIGNIKCAEFSMDRYTLVQVSSREKLKELTSKVIQILTEPGLTEDKKKCVYSGTVLSYWDK